jgi:hypothetical protein
MKQTGSHSNEFMHNNRGTIGNGAFYVAHAEML